MSATRTFTLARDEDVTGMSGTGAVAHGCEFPDGMVAMRWATSPYASTAIYHSIVAVEQIHGHDGRTRIVWDDEDVKVDSRPTIERIPIREALDRRLPGNEDRITAVWWQDNRYLYTSERSASAQVTADGRTVEVLIEEDK